MPGLGKAQGHQQVTGGQEGLGAPVQGVHICQLLAKTQLSNATSHHGDQDKNKGGGKAPPS